MYNIANILSIQEVWFNANKLFINKTSITVSLIQDLLGQVTNFKVPTTLRGIVSPLIF